MAHKTIGGIGWVDDVNDSAEAYEIILFAGKNGAGACTATGLNAGDKILSVTGTVVGLVGDQSAGFESVVTVDDQIQQSSESNLSANLYMALILKMS